MNKLVRVFRVLLLLLLLLCNGFCVLLLRSLRSICVSVRIKPCVSGL